MPHILEDRVLESSTSTGTGPFALVGAITGFRRFSAVCSVADTVDYFIEGIDPVGLPTGEYEYGVGAYSAANTLSRTLVRGSSSGGAAVAFSAGTKNVGLGLQGASFGRSLVTNGYQRLPGGLIMQWGTVAIGDVASATPVPVNFPIAFPTQCLNVQLTETESLAGMWNALLVSKGTTGFSFAAQEFAAVVQSAGLQWLALGN